MSCPCHIDGPSCVVSATVCEGYFVMLSPPDGVLSITEQGDYGTATLYNSYIVYEHNGNSLETDSFTYLNSSSTECVVNVTIEDTIPETTQVMIFNAEGDCEVGTPTFKWTLPANTTLVEGYTIYDQTIHVIVPLFDINNPLASYIFTVDVCCDYCNNCCKCDTITYNPPLCIEECGEEEECYCLQPCTEYNPLTGNCEPICTINETCCETIITGSTVAFGNSIVECNIYPTAQFNIEEVSLTITPVVTGANITDVLWHIFNFDGECSEPITNGCVDFRVCDDNFAILSTDNPTLNVSGYANYELIDGSLVFTLEEDYIINAPSDGYFNLYFTQEVITECGSAYKSTAIIGSLEEGRESYCSSGAINVYHDDFQSFTMCNVSAACNDISQSYCAECCDSDDCVPKPNCLNDTLYCDYGECYCFVDGVLIPVPEGSACCPECVSGVTVIPPCYQCVDGVIIAPNTNCPIGYIYNWGTCSCEKEPCAENQCIVPAGSNYCPDIEGCGCDDSQKCVECESVNCFTTIDCPYGCACDEFTNTCIDNPCDSDNCEFPNAVDYCPNLPNCGCDDIQCVPCNSVSCDTTEDCPIGCECVSGTCQDPCNLLQVDCDAYLVHNENDLTLAYNYVEDVNGNYFEIIPSLGLEIFLFSPLNTTWQVNLDNYINGWVDISTTYDMNGGTAIEVSPDGTLKFYTDYFDNNYVLIQLEVAGRMVWYRLEFVSGGLDYNEENFEVGGVFLCREIFTVESLTGIDWLVSNWIVSDPDIVLYTSPTILVIDCPGAPQFEGDIISIVAEVYNEINDCEISTCEYEYECECFGTKNCEEYFIDIAQNFDTSTNIWTLAADILYDNGSFNEVVFTDCQLLHSLQEPTPYDCSRCGGVPYLSSTYMTGTGDNVAEFYVDIPICDNLTANDSNCEDCVCGFTFEGAELIWYNGSEIRILVTDVNNAQICYQTNALGSTVSGDPCCIQHCEPLIFPTGCNLAIEASIECETFGNYIITINTTGNLGNITTVIINEVSVDFTYANNVVVTEILNYNPDINLEITVIDSNDCIATTDIDTYCCALEYNVLPIACEDNIYGINCQSCENGNEQIIGYNINVNNGGIPYDINIETNFTNYNVVGVTGSSVYIIGNQYFFNSCHDLLITNMEIDILGCVTTVTSVCVSEDCYVGFWYSSGFNNSLWNSPTSQSYLDYEWTGVEVNNTFYDFTLLAAGGIDMKAIVCQAAYELSLGTCTDEIMSAACSTVATGTDCYTDLSTCGLGTGQSVLYNSLHDKIAEKLLDAWNCRLNSYIVSINNQLSALGEDPLVLFQYNQTSLIFAPELLPDSSLVNQSLYYKYFVSTTEKYPSGLIKPVRNTSYLTVKPIINLTCGDSPSDCNIGYNCEECNVVVLNGLFSTTGECITECVVLCENDYIVTPNIVSFDIMVVDPPLDPTGSTVISEPLDIYGILYNASAIQACTTYNIDDDQTVQEYGTLKLKFNFPSLPDCVNFTKATIDIVSEPSGKGFGIGLDTGTYYAPLYLDNTKNGVLIDYDSFAEGTIPVVITGVVDFYYQNNYELIYPADSYAPSGVLNTTYDVSLIGVTTNPLDWVLEIVGFSGGDTYGTCDILHSVTITLYTDCTECGNECFINPEIELICQEEDGDYNGQYNILIDEEFNSGSTYNLEYYDHENNLQQYLNILLPYEIDQDDNNIIANTSYNFILTNNNTNCSAEVSVVPDCCLPTLTIQPYFCDTVTGASVYPMSMGFKINETFSGLGYTWIADIVSLNASFAPFSVVIDSDFIFVNELGVFDVSIPGITSGFNCEAPNSPINPTGTYNYDFVTNWATSEVQITFTVSGGAEDCTQVIDYTDFLCNNPEVDFPYGFTIESTNITCDLENDVLSVDIELYSDLSLSYVINVSGCSETTVYYESATPPTTNYNYTCLLYDNLPITITITNNSGCTETIVIPPQDITIDNVSFDCKTNIISFEILSPDNLLYYSCEECVNLSVSGTLMDTNPQTFFCDLDGLNPTGLTLVVSNDNDCFRTYDIDRSACVDECSNNPDLVIECEECGQSVFMASPFTQGFNEYDNLQYVIINDIPFIPETVIPPTGYTAVPMFPDDINYYLFEIFRDIVYAETGVLLVVNYDSLLKKGILYAIGPCCDSEISVLIKTVNLAVPDDILSPNNGFSLGANVTCNYIRNNIYEDFVCCSCFSAYPIGPVTNVSSDTIYWNYDNTDPDLLNWNEYTAGDCVINSVSGEIYFTREVTYTNSCRPSLLRYTFDTSTSTVTCNVMRSSFIARIINTSPFTIPSGTVFNLSWSGLGGATNFAGSFNGVINGAGTLFTTNTDILTNQQFRFAVAHNTTTCPGQTVILTVTTNDINIDPIIITLTT